MKTSSPLVWLDLEMTGLDPAVCTILEIAVVVTDNDLETIATGPCYAIHQPEEALAAMDEWNTTHHSESGLIDRVRESTITLGEAERDTLKFLRKYVPPRLAPLCGNSIGQDRRFLRRYMPDLHDYFHYRSVDVSSIKELVQRWYPEALQAPRKRQVHRALDDIHESIDELKHYRDHLFVPHP